MEKELTRWVRKWVGFLNCGPVQYPSIKAEQWRHPRNRTKTDGWRGKKLVAGILKSRMSGGGTWKRWSEKMDHCEVNGVKMYRICLVGCKLFTWGGERGSFWETKLKVRGQKKCKQTLDVIRFFVHYFKPRGPDSIPRPPSHRLGSSLLLKATVGWLQTTHRGEGIRPPTQWYGNEGDCWGPHPFIQAG